MRSPDISYFARTNHRNARVPFGIKQADRLSHMYVVGKTGTGKSTLLHILAGLEPHDSGTIDRRRDASILYLPQEPELATAPERDPYVPMPNCTLSVSPWTIETLSIGMPRRSATTCANVVSWPWP